MCSRLTKIRYVIATIKFWQFANVCLIRDKARERPLLAAVYPPLDLQSRISKYHVALVCNASNSAPVRDGKVNR